jgi:hypothetical protein
LDLEGRQVEDKRKPSMSSTASWKQYSYDAIFLISKTGLPDL